MFEEVRQIKERAMVSHLVRNLLTSPGGYGAAQMFWSDLWNDVMDGPGVVRGEWEQPWVANRLANGSELRDGNPIFSAFSSGLRRALRVIQHEPEEQGLELVWWLDSSTRDDGSNVEELVISCAMSEEAELLARSLIKSWVSTGAVPVGNTSRAN
jgi:hypothetical protein